MYNTNLKVIASIPDFNLLYDVFRYYAKGSDKKAVMEKIISRDIYGIRTEATRGRFLRGIHSTLINYKNASHRQLIYDCFTKESTLELKRIAIYLQIAINNQVFFELTNRVFLKLYFAGRLTVDKIEFSSYLYNLKEENSQVRKWDDSTIEEVASKYLTLLKKLGFLKGKQKKERRGGNTDQRREVEERGGGKVVVEGMEGMEGETDREDGRNMREGKSL